jgi:hypothetical protein
MACLDRMRRMKLRVYLWRDAEFGSWFKADLPNEGKHGPYYTRGYAIAAVKRRWRDRQFEFIDGPPPRVVKKQRP